MASLINDLSVAASAAFEAMGLDAKWGAVRRSDKPEFADFQCNGAMGAAKSAGKNPREIAGEIASALKDHPMVLSAEVAGPGFINIRVSDEAMSARAEFIRTDDMAGAEPAPDPKVTVIDFGGPNVAKPMHVGHLRSAVIGDTLVRLLRFLGDKVTGDTHLGDWGLQMGHLVTELYDEQPDLIYFDEAFEGPYPKEPPVTIDDLARLYPAASAKAKADAARNERSQNAVAELQAGRPGYRALLRHFIDVSVAALKVDYEFLNVHFDLWKGESDVDHLIPGLVEKFKAAGLSEEDDGAVIVRIERDSDKKDMPPIMLVNSRGGTGYHTTDLATIEDRMEHMDPVPELMLYVVDQRQALHFEQVFRAAEMLGLIDEGHLEHIGFGTVNGPDGKPFKTREGGVLRLADLNAMALAEAQKKIAEAGKLPEDMPEDERHDVAAAVALAALRFSDLHNTRTSNYVFDLDRFTSFEGKTGPYLLYAAVRIKSVLRKAEEAGFKPGEIRVGHDAERALVLQLDAFAATLLQAREKRMPHILCEHVYNLAQGFSAFYAALPIASEEDAGLRASRLALSAAVLKQLETGLDLLGIRVPERM
ncbi:arginine--tRNA ligase [Hyphomonas sp.]|uniref:arginine--tRNA ligase n=1 Tax=Hyphomonas sp. TaxID=87 RepID=UPI0025C050FC|nr:arginine--tRNA ligase [Hyphomonas sp.]